MPIDDKLKEQLTKGNLTDQEKADLEKQLGIKEAPKGTLEILYAKPYRGCMVYIQKIGFVFQYMAVVNSKIYSAYNVITPSKGKTKLTQGEINMAFKYIYASATVTVDTLADMAREEILSQPAEPTKNAKSIR